ncbi:MAG TPA: putative lipid II flippase FtsW [Humidesulfovibrio sp.]|uniref:putative lipid II flippase FtsW n=1 Tax=Humidesulfovibrio sp. TaxID=2910988 RepID=UPI002BB34B52|nr:putative lipid II flippase FtsW [Humidesulfovibrio sp.]HWR02965.1 putative lipid II flippase FtsW [Humidesulfovibrio sp.]
MNQRRNSQYFPMDYWLLFSALLLAGVGLIMVFSSSGIMAERFYHDKYLFFKKQAMFAVVGTAVMIFCARVNRRFFYDLTYVWVAVVIILLVLTKLIGATVGGGKRWIHLGPFSLQPLEFAKIVLVFYLAFFFAKKQELVQTKTFAVGVVPPFLVTGVMCLLLMMQPDFGGTAFLCFILFCMCLVGGTRVIYLVLSAVIGAWAGWMLIAREPYRLKRWTAFLDPFAVAKDEGYQLVQSLYAFGSGKFFGAGLGAGKQKLFFLPEAHNDFIMAVVGEELGFFGISLIFLLVAFLLIRGFRVAFLQEDLLDRFTAFGMCVILALGFCLNLAVVLGTVPPKGVPMPFISYGGSSLIASFICVGVLLNLSRNRS